MRIDLIITELDMGGAERCCASLAKYLHQAGHAVRLIALGPYPPVGRTALAESVQEAGIETHFLGAKNAWRLPSTLLQLRRWVRRDPPDIAQSFLWHANILASLVYPARGIPLVGGNRVAEPRRSRHWLGGWAGKRMHRVVCVSESVARWTEQYEGLPTSKLMVIPNGVEMGADSSFRLGDEALIASPIQQGYRSSVGVPETAPLLLFVGRLEKQKGVDILAERWDELLERCPQHHLVLIGDGTLRSSLDEQRLKSKAADRIHLLGYRSDVRTWLQMSDLLLLPARYEGMPNVIIEAMAEGLSVVATRVDGIAELLGEQTQDQTVDRGDWTAWIEKVVFLAQNSELATAVGFRNRERCRDQFSLDRQLARYEQLYQTLSPKK